MNAIDRSVPIAAYYQIATDIRRRIASGEWNQTMRLPAEATLAQEYGVSRMTMRQALAELVKDGIVTRRRGSGTFINERPPSASVSSITLPLPVTLVRSLRALGYTPGIEVLQARVLPVPSPTIADALDIDVGEPVAFFERIVHAEERPLVIVRAMIPDRLCPGITQRPLINDSIHITLRERYGITLREVQHWIESVRATDEDAATLRTSIGTPLLLLTSVYYDDRDRPVEHVTNLWLGDAMRLSLRAPAETLRPDPEEVIA